jgi:hypothetical protein
MRFDKYTKAVLTVIAVCLVWLCARDILLCLLRPSPPFPDKK